MKKLLLYILLITAVFSCKNGEKQSQSTNSNQYFERAKEFKDSNLDSAFVYFNLGKNEFLSKNDSIGVARSLINMAIIQSDKGDYYGSIETSLEADKYLKTSAKNKFVNNLYSSNYNNLAVSSKSLKKYLEAETYYQSALKVTKDESYKSVINNNIGDVLIIQNKADSATKYLQKSLNTNDSIGYARALNNLAKAQLLKNRNYDPTLELEKALKIRLRQKDTLGLNSSFATLADYFYNRDNSKALYYAKLMLNRASKNKSPDDQLEALEKIIKLEPQNYLQNFFRFQKTNDSMQTARNQDKSQFAVVRYDVEVKNAEFQTLKNKSFKQNIGLAALALALIGGAFYYKKRKKRLEQEKELEVKNTQLKMSKKVHDVVANGIYQVMTKIENQDHFDKNKALDELEFVYEKSRDISYEKMDAKNDEKIFREKISELIGSFNNENVNTYLAGNDEDIWKDLQESKQEEIYQIVRELLVNMKKHSKADRVVFRFERENNVIKIFYTDNGIGISGDVIYKNGLSSTVSRIETIAGEITFDTKTEKGLKINISFPVS